MGDGESKRGTNAWLGGCGKVLPVTIDGRTGDEAGGTETRELLGMYSRWGWETGHMWGKAVAQHMRFQRR